VIRGGFRHFIGEGVKIRWQMKKRAKTLKSVFTTGRFDGTPLCPLLKPPLNKDKVRKRE
jgi:hypothetical protein